ncbi:serine protease htrA-like protein [Striga asiatica]|uniref:Serine protease htrA-like protein n=1 Tax=Striga asiatica TaxID=4170 RepID=A0A5A7QV76_STRAF|nr:serine protease htrA-like protein [Striga asiatica]
MTISEKTEAEPYHPWERNFNGKSFKPNSIISMSAYGPHPSFDVVFGNLYLDIHTKKAALRASPSVVSLVSYSGGEEIFQCSGTIIESNVTSSIILTSADLIRIPSPEVGNPTGVSATPDEDIYDRRCRSAIANPVNVVVHLSDGQEFDGQILGFDSHYNLAVIEIKSATPLTAACLRLVDDSISVDPSDCASDSCPHSDSYNLTPGDCVIALGRFFRKPYELMAAPGEFSISRCDYECKELFRANCRITRCGVGGPLVNCSGEVIGTCFYDLFYTPFLPVNLTSKWWYHCKRMREMHQEIRRPLLSMELTNLYAVRIGLLEKVIQKFPNTFKGVIIEEVAPGSSAQIAGIFPNDIIIEFGGKRIRSFLELLEMMWDNVGNHVKVVIVRHSDGVSMPISMLATFTICTLNSGGFDVRHGRMIILTPFTFCNCQDKQNLICFLFTSSVGSKLELGEGFAPITPNPPSDFSMMNWRKRKAPSDPWERQTKGSSYTPDDMAYVTDYGLKRPKFHVHSGNLYLDIRTKKAALSASPSVVSLVSYSGGNEICQCSGTIIESNGTSSIILTSADLIRVQSPDADCNRITASSTPEEDEEERCRSSIADPVKVVVYISDGEEFDGQVLAFDSHYNLAVIEIQSAAPLRAARLRLIDDSMTVDPSGLVQGTHSELHLDSDSYYNLTPGDSVVAIGRYCKKPYEIMAAPGEYSINSCEYDCKELFRANCTITRCGVGGPLINSFGEVIGICFFFDTYYTPFLPVNLTSKWWYHCKRNREIQQEIRRPLLSMELTNLYAVQLGLLEKVVQKFPNTFKGVVVDEVEPGSSAQLAGLRPDDVIVEFGEKRIRSFLELLEMMWDNVGKHVKLVVVRDSDSVSVPISMMIDELAVFEFRKMNIGGFKSSQVINPLQAMWCFVGTTYILVKCWFISYLLDRTYFVGGCSCF